MISTPGAVRRTHSLLAVLAATALALVGVSVAAPPAAHADATSPVEIFLERGSASYGLDPSIKVQDAGWWAHEGPSRSELETAVSSDLTDGAGNITDASQAAWLATLGVDDYPGLDGFNHLGIAFVPTSADGSAEQPTVTAGESALDVFDWVTDLPFPSSFSPTRDDVYTVSTKAEFNAWVADGMPSQQADANLVYHDIFEAGQPVSNAPKGKSLLNRWTAGQDISLVVFQFDTLDANGIPVLGPQSIEGGHAVTAWFEFSTVATPGRAVATSGGYQLVSDVVTPTVTLADSWSGGSDTGTLKATLTGPDGGALTGATGTVQFSALPKGASTGTYTSYGAPVDVQSNGTASVAVTGLAPGQIQKFKATYVPDAAAAGSYAEATGGPRTVVRPSASTTTTLTVKGSLVAGASQTLTATVAPSDAAGTVTFKDGSTTLGSAAVSDGKATKAVKLGAGSHALTASFASSAGWSASSGTKTVTVKKADASIRTAIKPKQVHAGDRPKLTVTVQVTGLVANGKVKLEVDPPKGRTKTITAKLRRGKATIALPKAVKGKTKVTAKYAGNASIASATRSLTIRVRG